VSPRCIRETGRDEGRRERCTWSIPGLAMMTQGPVSSYWLKLVNSRILLNTKGFAMADCNGIETHSEILKMNEMMVTRHEEG